MTVYTTTNGAIIADLAALRAIPSTDLPSSGFVVLFVAAENSWYEYNSSLTSGDVTPTDSPATGRWIRIGRDKLLANRTYYVRADGNDANTGLADNSGGAFLTWSKAQDVLSTLDGNGFAATVKFTGTFTTGINITKSFVGFSSIQIDGNVSTPSNSFINVSGGSAFVSDCSTPILVRGLKLDSSSVGLWVKSGVVEINGVIDFGANTFSHIYVSGQKAQLNQRSNYTISGNSPTHIQILDQGLMDANNTAYTVTLSGSRTFSSAFIISNRGASGIFVNITYSGTATGSRYSVGALSGIWAIGTTFAGSTDGTADPKGYYGT
jgi:hypothetical protein